MRHDARPQLQVISINDEQDDSIDLLAYFKPNGCLVTRYGFEAIDRRDHLPRSLDIAI